MSPSDPPTPPSASERSTPALPKENVILPLRPLAPKAAPRFRPLAVRGSSESLFASSLGQTSKGHRQDRAAVRCPVCFKRQCPLTSHKFHDEARRLRRSQAHSATRTPVSQDNTSASYAVDFANLYEMLPSDLGKTNILSQQHLPGDLDRPLMQRLFHSWFVLEAPNHFTVPQPVPNGSDLLHSPFLAPASIDTVLCLSILTISAASRIHEPPRSNKVLALTLCDRAMSKLRERVHEDGSTVSDITIAAATYLWAANLYLSDDTSLRQHASSVRALVEARKNAPESGLSEAVTSLLKWVDIMHCLRLNIPSQYPDNNKHRLRQQHVDRQSGGAWCPGETQRGLLSDETLLHACQQCCKTIDLLDQSDPEEMDGMTYFYLYQRVAQLYQENSILRARYSGTGTVNECVTLAIDILRLLVFNGGGQGASSQALNLQANYLSTAIQAAGGGMFWRTKMQLFVWLVLLVYVCNPSGTFREWSEFVLKSALEHVFGARIDWSRETIIQLETTLLTFGWSSAAMSIDLKELCDQLWT